LGNLHHFIASTDWKIRRESEGFHQDNPLIRADTPEEKASAENWMRRNLRTTTGWYHNLMVDPKDIVSLPGRKEEHLRDLMGTNRVYELAEDMQQNGFREWHAPLIIVESDGQAFIYEGNHRIRAAIKAGLDRIPVDIRYEGGSEELPHVWAPPTVMKTASTFTPPSHLFHGTSAVAWKEYRPDGTLYLTSDSEDALLFAYEAAAHDESKGIDPQPIILKISFADLQASGVDFEPDWNAYSEDVNRGRTWEDTLKQFGTMAVYGDVEGLKDKFTIVDRPYMRPKQAAVWMTIPLSVLQTRIAKIAISLPEIVQQTNAFSKKNRPGCVASLLNSNPKELFLNYNVKCKLKTSDPAGHDVRVKFDVSKVQESQMAKDLDVQVSCSCPAFLYWGAQWNLHQRDGLYGEPRPELVAPTERLDLRGNFVICKHAHAVFERILPSVQHNIIKILRERAIEQNKEKMDDTPDKLRRKQDEMKKRKEKDKAKNEKVQQELLEALRKREEEKMLEEDGVVERDDTATPLVVETPKAPAHPETSPIEFPEDAVDLLEDEDRKLKQKEHQEVKNQPHLHTGLPYETDTEKQEHGHKLPSDRELLKLLKQKKEDPNRMKNFLDKKFKQKRTSLENSLLAGLEVEDDAVDADS
jgi:hypothetical protein